MPSDSEIHQCVVAEYESFETADIGLKVLETADFNNKTVSVITQGSDESIADVTRLQDGSGKSPPAEGSVAAGGAVGGSLGAILGTASLIGPFMVVGPLAGMAVGAGAAGLLSATEKWGMKEDVTCDYEQRVSDGGVVVIVTDDNTRLDEAHRLLKTTGPKSLERFNT